MQPSGPCTHACETCHPYTRVHLFIYSFTPFAHTHSRTTHSLTHSLARHIRCPRVEITAHDHGSRVPVVSDYLVQHRPHLRQTLGPTLGVACVHAGVLAVAGGSSRTNGWHQDDSGVASATTLLLHTASEVPSKCTLHTIHRCGSLVSGEREANSVTKHLRPHHQQQLNELARNAAWES